MPSPSLPSPPPAFASPALASPCLASPCLDAQGLCCGRCPALLRANHDFAALPERLYIISEGKIAYQGGPGPFEYNVDEIALWLEAHADDHAEAKAAI